LRNTTSLLGRAGTGHGPVHWSGNFDEIQDFEGAIRTGFAGGGFLSDELYFEGTRSEPLGDPKAGFSEELDALALYVSSLSVIPRSPFKNDDGTYTSSGSRGEELFVQLGCDSCHSGEFYTDSAEGNLHDVGTLKETSGSRLGAELTGIDTPTLLGIWQTAPYLHDGSAPSLRDVLTSSNSSDMHGETSTLADGDLDDLVDFLKQLDGRDAPADLPPVEGVVTDVPSDDRAAAEKKGCSVVAFPGGRVPKGVELYLLAALAFVVQRRRRATQSRLGARRT
jgi:hypothetical protein